MINYWVYIAVCGCVLEAVFICLEYAKKLTTAVVIKGIASVFFVFLGIVLLSVTTDSNFGGFVLAGLVFGAVGDVLLGLRKIAGKAGEKIFMAGIAAFFIGHLLYIVALSGRGANALIAAVPICAVLSVVLIPLVLKRIEVAGKLKVFGIVYITLVFLMTGCAAGLLIFQPLNIGHVIFTVGAALFALSDVILILHLFGRKKYKTFRAFNLSAYYIGQILIALSLMYI